MDPQAPPTKFSTAKTWQALHPPTAMVPWANSVWFKDRIPKHAFIVWVAAWNRLHTRDRLRRWGFQLPSVCILCNEQEETRDHLFFQCDFSGEIWSFFTARVNLNPPPLFADCLRWIHSTSTDKNVSLIIKLLFQASIYFIWSERNARIHSDVHKSPSQITKEIERIIRARLDPLSRLERSPITLPSPLSSWFSMFQF